MSEWTPLALLRAGGYGVHRYIRSQTDVDVVYDLVPEPHAWGPARPMQIAATIGTIGSDDIPYWGKATISLADSHELINNVAGSIEFIPIEQQTIENVRSEFATISPQLGISSSAIISVQQLAAAPSLLGISVPTNARHQILLTLTENGISIYRKETHSLVTVGNQMRLWAFQPDKSHLSPVIGFGIYDTVNQIVFCYATQSLNFLATDSLGFLPKAFASVALTFPAGRSNGTASAQPSPAPFAGTNQIYQTSESWPNAARFDVPVGEVMVASCQYHDANEIGSDANPALRWGAGRGLRNFAKPYSGMIGDDFPFGPPSQSNGQAFRSSLLFCLSHAPTQYDERNAVRKVFSVPTAKSLTHCPALRSQDKAGTELKVKFLFDPVAVTNSVGDVQSQRALWHGTTQVVQSSGNVSVSPQLGLASYVVVQTLTEGAHSVTIQDGTFAGQMLELSFMWYPRVIGFITSPTIQDTHGNSFSASIFLEGTHRALRVVWDGSQWVLFGGGTPGGQGGANSLAIHNHELTLGVTSPLGEQYAPGSYYGANEITRELFRVPATTAVPLDEVRWTSLTNRSTLPPIRFATHPDLAPLTLRDAVAQQINALSYAPVPAPMEFFLAGEVTWQAPIKCYAFYDKVFTVERMQCFGIVRGVSQGDPTAQRLSPSGAAAAEYATSGNLDAWQSGAGKILYADSGQVSVSGLLVVDVAVHAENFGIHWGGVLIGQDKFYWPDGPFNPGQNLALNNFVNDFDTADITAARWYINPPGVPKQHRYSEIGDLSNFPAIGAEGYDWLDLPIPANPQWNGPSSVSMEKRRICYRFFATLTSEQASSLRDNGFVDVPVDHENGDNVLLSDPRIVGKCCLLVVGTRQGTGDDFPGRNAGLPGSLRITI